MTLTHFGATAAQINVLFDEVYNIMTSTAGNYAIMLLEPIPISQINRKKMQDLYLRKATSLIEENMLTEENVEILLLKILKSFALQDKIALFKAPDNNLLQWSRLTYNNGQVSQTPCP